MISADTRFYFIGGNLERDAPSYVERDADGELYDALSRGELCYVLDSRQMGKSSLMVRTAARLRAAGAAVARLDLNASGQNLTAEQWYADLLYHLGLQLDLEEELEAFELEGTRFSPLQRWMHALREVVLTRCPGRVVIFIDEIDYVLRLPFSTDEFFAAIRECYNRRTADPEFHRLTFCLLGVASPSDLIRDSRTTPFNIGRRIQLHDFSEVEAMPLARGLVVGEDRPTESRRDEEEESPALLRRALHWTGGHPYLTQRLCQAVAEARMAADHRLRPAPAASPAVGGRRPVVDRLCEELFLSRTPGDADHLQLVPQRLLQGHDARGGLADPASLLDLYARVHRTTVRDDRPFLRALRRGGLLGLYWRARYGPPIRDDDTNALIEILRLSGMIRVVDGVLQVRNRIYQRVFNREWVTEHMPDAELRRQRAAFRRGLLRATTLAGAVVVVTTGLAVTAMRQARRADQQRRVAQTAQAALRRHLYAAQMSVAQQAWEDGDVQQARRLLELQRPQSGQEDLRGFEWRYLWRLCQADAPVTLRGHTGGLWSVAFSPDGTTLATGSMDGTTKLWNLATNREIATLRGHRLAVSCVAFSPDGKTLASTSFDETAKLWDVATHRQVASLAGLKGGARSAVFSPNGRLLALGSGTTLKLWDVPARRMVAPLKANVGPLWSFEFWAFAFSPDGRLLATTGGDYDKSVRLWDLATRREIASLKGHQAGVSSVVFSPDGRTVASASADTTVKLWDALTKREIATLGGHRGIVDAVAFSPDGKSLASAAGDLTVRLWDTATKQEVAILRGHQAEPWAMAFSPDGRRLATGSLDGMVKLWNLRGRETDILRGHRDGIWGLAFSPDGRLLATGSQDNAIKVWNLASHRLLGTLHVPAGVRRWVAFSPDSHTLASGSDRVRLWDVRSRRQIASLTGHTGWIQFVAFSPNGQLLAAGGGDKTVKLWNVATRRVVGTLTGHTDRVVAASFSPDGKTLASAGVDGTVRLWDVATKREIATLNGHEGQVNDAAFSPDGKTLATCGWDRKVKLWDIPTQHEVATLEGRGGIVDSVAFSRDGKTLASCGAGNQIKLWNVATQHEVATLTGHQAQVWGLAFSPDGNTLATSSMDTTVRLWRALPLAQTALPAGAGSPAR